MFDSASTAAAVQNTTEAAPEPLRIELAPEIILPSQFHGGFRHDASLRPEKRLMLAVLEEAVGDFQRFVAAPGREGQRMFRNAEDWFASEDTEWPFSFVNICQTLGLDVGYVRAGLGRWRDAQRARVSRGEPVVRIQLRRVAGIRSKATGRAPIGRARSRW
jgi:hypothetical protein